MSPGTGNDAALGAPAALDAVRRRVEGTLRAFLEQQRADAAAVDASAARLLDEISRVVWAGGKRLRPAFCYWGHRAAGGEDGEAIIRVGAAIELLHTFALIHDDVMDRSEVRRGVPASHVHLAREHRDRGLPGDAERYGIAAAILVGDLAAVLADRLFLDSGFGPEPLAAGLRRFDRMRTEMAAGQLLDLEGAGRGSDRLSRGVRSLKAGSYTVEGPLHVGAALAGGSLEVMASLARFAAPLGEAFQMRDDVLDARQDSREDSGGPPGGNGLPVGSPGLVNDLVRKARAALDASALAGGSTDALSSLAGLIALPGG